MRSEQDALNDPSPAYQVRAFLLGAIEHLEQLPGRGFAEDRHHLLTQASLDPFASSGSRRGAAVRPT